MAKQLGIDLGTANTVIHMKGRGIVLREPSVVATEVSSKKILAVGEEAKRMMGKTPDRINAQNPLKDGVIADFDLTRDMLRSFFKTINAVGLISRPEVLVCTPYSGTEVERRAVQSVVYDAGAKNINLVSEPMAAAVGSGLDVSGHRGSVIVDIGGGTSEVAVISYGGIVFSDITKTAGNAMDRAITDYMKNEHHVLISDIASETIKKSIGSVHPTADRGETEVRGISQRTGLPVTVTINSAQVRAALTEQVNDIVRIILRALESTPPELSADIYDYGIMLAGGGALLGGIQQYINERAGVRVTVAKKPLECVAMGIGRIIDRNMTELIDPRGR